MYSFGYIPFLQRMLTLVLPFQIIEDINRVKESPIFGYEIDFTKFLGGKTLNESGAVVGATSIRNIWYTVRA